MLGGSSGAREREAEGDGAEAVTPPPAIEFPAEGSDPKYDESDVPAELQVLKGPLQQPTFPFAVANQLLLVSLLEHLSHVHEPNPLRSRQTFIKMGLLSSFTCSDEFSSLRLHHNRAISHLMRSAKERVRQDPCEDNSHIQKIRSREIAFEAQTSRYLNEFEELAILGKDRISIQLPSLEVMSDKEDDRNQHVKNDESNSSSIIFAEFTSEKGKSLGESGIDNQNNRLVNCNTNLITRTACEFESSSLLQGNGLADLPSRSIVEHQLPFRHHSDLEENFTSTGESSENLSLLGQTEVQYHLMLHIQMQLCELSLWDWIVERNQRGREYVDEAACPYVMASVATKIFQELVEGVFYIHNMGIVHRDLKQVKIGDFGLACTDIIQKNTDWIDRDGKRTLTHTSRVGTCLYASPEQLEGSEYDAKSDMYSLGVILLELFQPFGTEMERVHVLTGLRSGQIPESLSKRCPMKILEQEKEIEELKKQLSLLSQDKGAKDDVKDG
ncbi:hypothetical protein GH733_017917, partial [Mirounga leonina]